MRFTKPIVVPWLVLALALVGALTACDGNEDRVRLYHAEPLAPGLSGEDVADLEVLGSRIVEGGVNFSVYSAHATRLDLLLFEDPDANQPARRYEMSRFGDVWNVYVEGIGRGQHYGYIAWGANWPYDPEWFPGSIHGFAADVDAAGNRFNPNKLLLDPYARALHRDHDWSVASLASGPARTASTFSAAAKSIVWESDYQWSEAESDWRAERADPAVGGRWNGLIIYEVHPKGFTASPASGVKHPGTYRGIAENVDYLVELGVTAVELLPIHEKPLDGGYWGYNNISFFAPELSYAATPRPLEVIDEVKAMIDVLHQNGIEVIVDVVYNHTGEGGLWREHIEMVDTLLDPTSYGQLVDFDPKEVAGLYSFRGLDNRSYYALSDDNQTYHNNTGVGNQTRPNHRPMRRLIMDSLRFMVEELHVDGFRFDLAPVLGASDENPDAWDDPANTVLQDIIDDPLLQRYHTRVIAEPWAAGGEYGFRLGAFPAAMGPDSAGVGWYEWNGHFRDWWRSFVNNDSWSLASREGIADAGFTMTGSYELMAWNERRPYHSVNFVTSHDGFTLYDLFSYDEKQNGCGPLNPVCCNDPTSPFCDRESGDDHNRSRDLGQGAEPLKRQLMRNLFVATLISHGTPMLLGGDEWMRTQLGNNNAYSTQADNPFNWFDWGGWKPDFDRNRMHDFVSKLIAFRLDHLYALSPEDYGAGAPFAWKSADNGDSVDWSGRHVMQHYYDPSAGPEMAILINMELKDVDFALPEGPRWRRIVDTRAAFDSDEYVTGSGHDARTTANFTADGPLLEDRYSVAPRSIVIAVAEAE